MPQHKVPFRHVMKGNKSTRTPGTLIFLDTETTPEDHPTRPNAVKHRFMMGVAIKVRWEGGKATRREVLTFWELQHFWPWVYSHMHKDRPVYLFSHNAGFDLTTVDLWGQLDSGALTLKSICRVDPPTIVKCHADGKKLVCLDTLNYFRQPLASLGTMVGLPKGELPGEDASHDDWERYCLRDAEIVEATMLAWIGFVRDNDLGVFKPTAPGQAMQAYRHRFRQDPIVFHGCAAAFELEREAYFGGRNECFYVGRVDSVPSWVHSIEGDVDHGPRRTETGPVTVLDCTAFYPSVMAGHRYPIAHEQIVDDPPVAKLDEWLKTKGIIARVLLDTDEAFPLKTKTKGTIHARGKFWTTLCGPELVRATALGAVERCEVVSLYTLGSLFDSFVEALWGLRHGYERAGSQEFVALAKLMMNSLYGKFGQRSHEWIDRGDIEPPDDWGHFIYLEQGTEEPSIAQAIAGLTQLQGDGGETNESFPGIAAYVTSYGRMQLRFLRSVAGPENVLYCDTDSLHVLPAGLDRLQSAGWVRPGEMGYLRVEKTAETAEYRNLKDYTLDGVDTIAGIRRTATKVGQREWEQFRFQRLNSILAGKPDGSITVDTEKVVKSACYGKGVVTRSGWTVPHDATHLWEDFLAPRQGE